MPNFSVFPYEINGSMRTDAPGPRTSKPVWLHAGCMQTIRSEKSAHALVSSFPSSRSRLLFPSSPRSRGVPPILSFFPARNRAIFSAKIRSKAPAARSRLGSENFRSKKQAPIHRYIRMASDRSRQIVLVFPSSRSLDLHPWKQMMNLVVRLLLDW